MPALCRNYCIQTLCLIVSLYCLTDIDECANAGACPNAECVNERGAYTCICNWGYKSTTPILCEGECQIVEMMPRYIMRWHPLLIATGVNHPVYLDVFITMAKGLFAIWWGDFIVYSGPTPSCFGRNHICCCLHNSAAAATKIDNTERHNTISFTFLFFYSQILTSVSRAFSKTQPMWPATSSSRPAQTPRGHSTATALQDTPTLHLQSQTKTTASVR